MEELDMLKEIGKFPEIFRYYKSPFECIYYHDVESTESLRIYVKCDASSIAQLLYLFELVREEGGRFTLKTVHKSGTDADVAEIKKEEVVNLVSKRITAKTFVDVSWTENHRGQKDKYLSDKGELKKILEKLIEDFIR